MGTTRPLRDAPTSKGRPPSGREEPGPKWCVYWIGSFLASRFVTGSAVFSNFSTGKGCRGRVARQGLPRAGDWPREQGCRGPATGRGNRAAGAGPPKVRKTQRTGATRWACLLGISGRAHPKSPRPKNGPDYRGLSRRVNANHRGFSAHFRADPGRGDGYSALPGPKSGPKIGTGAHKGKSGTRHGTGPFSNPFSRYSPLRRTAQQVKSAPGLDRPLKRRGGRK